jgi:hypothetical protein
VTNGQAGAACPQCGSTAAVHSIEELAALARSRLGMPPGSAAAGPPGSTAAGPPGYAAEPRPGPPGPPPGYAAEPRPGPPGPVPGYAAEPRPGRPGRWPGRGSPLPDNPIGDGLSLEDDIAGAALNVAARFIGRAISRRVQRTVSEQVVPALAARQEATLRAQIEIAERHPDLRACLTDQVVFLAGGRRALPMPSLTGLTVEQADALVARLRDG